MTDQDYIEFAKRIIALQREFPMLFPTLGSSSSSSSSSPKPQSAVATAPVVHVVTCDHIMVRGKNANKPCGSTSVVPGTSKCRTHTKEQKVDVRLSGKKSDTKDEPKDGFRNDTIIEFQHDGQDYYQLSGTQFVLRSADPRICVGNFNTETNEIDPLTEEQIKYLTTQRRTEYQPLGREDTDGFSDPEGEPEGQPEGEPDAVAEGQVDGDTQGETENKEDAEQPTDVVDVVESETRVSQETTLESNTNVDVVENVDQVIQNSDGATPESDNKEEPESTPDNENTLPENDPETIEGNTAMVEEMMTKDPNQPDKVDEPVKEEPINPIVEKIVQGEPISIVPVQEKTPLIPDKKPVQIQTAIPIAEEVEKTKKTPPKAGQKKGVNLPSVPILAAKQNVIVPPKIQTVQPVIQKSVVPVTPIANPIINTISNPIATQQVKPIVAPITNPITQIKTAVQIKTPATVTTVPTVPQPTVKPVSVSSVQPVAQPAPAIKAPLVQQTIKGPAKQVVPQVQPTKPSAKQIQLQLPTVVKK